MTDDSSRRRQQCVVCDGDIPEKYDKYDEDAPVYDPENDQVYHLGCEDEMFDSVYARVAYDA